MCLDFECLGDSHKVASVPRHLAIPAGKVIPNTGNLLGLLGMRHPEGQFISKVERFL